MDGTHTSQQLLTMHQFAARAGVSYSTVVRWVGQDRLIHYQPGGRKGRVLIPRNALDQSGPGLRGQQNVDGIDPVRPKRNSGPRPKWMDDDAAW